MAKPQQDIQLLASTDKSPAMANTGRTPTPITDAGIRTALPQNAAVDASASTVSIGPRGLKLADRSFIK